MTLPFPPLPAPRFRDAIDRALEHEHVDDRKQEHALAIIEVCLETAMRVAQALPAGGRVYQAQLRVEEALYHLTQAAKGVA